MTKIEWVFAISLGMVTGLVTFVLVAPYIITWFIGSMAK